MNPEVKVGQHRRDVDGMRAVAVVLVILYHLKRTLAPGGFVGVDIFFAISGYVVTRSSLAAPAKSAIHAMGRFWRRRILRIVPAMLLTTIVTFVVLGTMTAPFPTESYVGNLRTGICAIFGLGNLYLYKGASDYFRADALTNPFVHTWSLGVEEQFYFVFAILFVGVLGLLKQPGRQLGNAIATMCALGGASYAAFLIAAQRHPLLTYYLLPFRFWEIAAGSLLANWELKSPNAFQWRNQKLNGSLQLLAVISLVTVIWFYKETGFPTVEISVAVGAAILLIMTGNSGATAISRCLSAPLFVGIGLISYSLYLWHYPVLLFWNSNFGLDRITSILLAVLVISVAATISYWTVERKFRYSKASFAKVLLPCLCLNVIGTLGLGWLLQVRPGVLYGGSKQSWSTDWRRPVSFAYSGDGRILSKCDMNAGAAVPANVPNDCFSRSQDEHTERTVFLVGDSHAFADWPMASFGASTGAYRFATLAHDGCNIGGDASTRAESCEQYWRNMPTLVENTVGRNDSVLIACYMPFESSDGTKRAMGTIGGIAKVAKNKGAEVIVEAPLPVFDKPAYLCTKEWFRTNYAGCLIDRAEVQRRRAAFMAELKEVVQKESNVRIWDALPILCPTATCSQFEAGTPIFRDANHLSYYGARSLGPAFVSFWKGRPEGETTLANRVTGSQPFSD